MTGIVNNKDTANRRIQRWLMTLSEFEFGLERAKGDDNVVADCLSTVPYITSPDPFVSVVWNKDTLNDLLRSKELWDVTLALEQGKDEPFRPEATKAERKRRNRIKRTARHLSIKLVDLYHKGRKVVTDQAERLAITRTYHAIDHFGAEATATRILRDYWWPDA